MKVLYFFFLVLSTLHTFPASNSLYIAIQSDSLALIDKEISKQKSVNVSPSQNAYLGALLMKKAHFIKNLNEKMNVFNEGRNLLEAAIKAEPYNIEFRFLRLIIQENCPKILKYNTHIDEDVNLIVANFKTTDIDLQNVIKDYSKKSNFLNLIY